ncbi:Cullin family-domain-containing protein [Suillus subalutaceus]|uniref:Cullin family-domain-containing protein n=1 Tax=Suillus subalutaceus TaxID=48586 RepID=UPI001B884497|nr:Cullin family-domain-containing protein [Suillus subalutaceus]KAG1852408.1 Cullin family-domain-containing protein [Suillus subalutaceus]
MTDVISLLTFPDTSKAFTAYRSTVVDVDDRSASHPRKTPRLDADSDSGSASRSRDSAKGKNVDRGGPVSIQVHGFAGGVVGSALNKAYDNLSARLSRSIRALLEKGSDQLSSTYEGVYTACRGVVCVAGRGEGLYEMLKVEIHKCVNRLAEELEKTNKEGVEWIGQFVETCAWFEGQVALLESLLTYLDRAYVLKNPSLPSIHDLAFTRFRERIFSGYFIVDKLQKGISTWVTWERNEGQVHIHRPFLKELVSHLVTHYVYDAIFERHFVEQTREYFSKESYQMVEVEKAKAKVFLAHCNQRTNEEQGRARDVMSDGTIALVKDAAIRALFEKRLEWMAKEVFTECKGTTDLKKAYALFASVDGLPVLCREFKAYVQRTVQDIVKDASKDDEMVNRLLEFKSFADSTLKEAFVDSSTKQNNQDFAYGLIDAFTKGFKARRNKPAEQIAKHVDRLMRHGQRGVSDAAFEALLDAALALYRFTDDKDVFRTFYHRALAKRLLLERSASDDFEKAMLKKLKEKYDPEFGMGDHMFNDLALSRDIMREYHTRIGHDSSAHKLSVMVLQRSFWPFPKRTKGVDLPSSMQADLDNYATFYKQKHQGHKLDWDHSLGTATVKARFVAGPKDLTVSLYQAIVLLLFNEETEIAYKHILEETRMDDGELRRTLQSLACANKKVLKKRPVGKDVNDNDVFYFNLEFTDPRAKVHINSIQAKETAEESQRTQSHIEGDRKHYLDAAIVRIMKAKKELSHEQLKNETIDAVKSHFVPEVSVIKQRIDGLVEQEYLRRDEEDRNLYIYVA